MSLSHRNRQCELMDDPSLAPEPHHAALRGLRRANAISGTVKSIWRPIKQLAAELRRPIRILDVASGGGDNAIGIAQKARAAKIDAVVSGCDLSETAIDYAMDNARRRNADVRFFVADAISHQLPGGYDVITSSLFLHHLDDDDVVTLLKSMTGSGAEMIVISDLLRSRLGYALCWTGIRLITRSHICHVDGPLSVEGAYTIDELKTLAIAAGLESMRFEKRWPERCLMTWRRNGESLTTDPVA